MKSFVKLSNFVIIFFIFFVNTSFTYAGGPNRMEINAPDGYGWTNTYVNVTGYVTTDSGSASVGEKVEFRVLNPRQGDRCETYGNGTSAAGWVGGTCYADIAGMVVIYLYSIDKGDKSNDRAIYFYEPPTPTPTLIPTSTPKPKATSTPIPTHTPIPSPTPINPLSTKKPTITFAPTRKPKIISTTKNTVPENNSSSSVKSESAKNNSNWNIWLVSSIIASFLVIILGGTLSFMYLKKKLES